MKLTFKRIVKRNMNRPGETVFQLYRDNQEIRYNELLTQLGITPEVNEDEFPPNYFRVNGELVNPFKGLGNLFRLAEAKGILVGDLFKDIYTRLTTLSKDEVTVSEVILPL